MIIGALIGGLLGVFGFVHVVSMDAWVTTYPVSCTIAGVIVAFMLSIAMFGKKTASAPLPNRPKSLSR
jgi:hypothetical protein